MFLLSSHYAIFFENTMKNKSYANELYLLKLILAAGCFSIIATTSPEVFAQDNVNKETKNNVDYQSTTIFDKNDDAFQIKNQGSVQDKGFYIGLGLARTDLQSESLLNTFPGDMFQNDSKATSYKAIIGYQFNKNLSIQGGYTDSGKFNYNRTERTLGNESDFKGSFKYKSGSLDMIGHIPVTSNFSWLGIVGTHKGNISNHIYHQTLKVGNLTGVPDFPNKNGLSFKYGLGMQYSITHRVSLRASLERYNFKEKIFREANTSMVSVNFIVPLGSR